MRRSVQQILAITAAAAVTAMTACSSSTNDSDDGGDGDGPDEVEVFSWWTGPGEEDGLAALIEVFNADHPDIRFNNAAISGGAGSNAKAILASRLQANDPPDSYQRHAGLELQDDVLAGKVEDISHLYDQEGWREVFPEGLIEHLTIDDEIYSVPVNIHRSNLLYFNPQVLADAGIDAPPQTWDEFLDQAETLEAAGFIPLSIGSEWTQKHLLENVLLGELGPDAYDGLWTGETDWASAEVTGALDTFTAVLASSDIDSAAADWQPALDKLVEGDAAYNVMGDWADSYLSITKGLAYHEEYDVVPSPGSDGIYNFLSDTFTLPVGAKHRQAAEQWLVTAGSQRGQDAFNPVKGSIPARTDADAELYNEYLTEALDQWQDPATRIVGSLAHGVVANNAWNAEIDTALALFVQSGDAATFAEAVMQSYEATK